jgi:RIO-like serine/threonine protein kinase
LGDTARRVIYRYIEGRSLKELKDLPDDFFDQLLVLLGRIHARNVVYLDMNKRSNILLGADGRPHLIDFQISLYINGHVPFCEPVSDYLRRILQQADVYHLFKHKRRLCPHLLTDQERILSLNRNLPMQAHRILARPLRKLRRFALKALHDNGILPVDRHRDCPPPKDPTRAA